MRVLIVEDNLRLAQSIQDILKQIWYDSDICTDGISGGYQLQEGAYDAMILDLMLPGKDGITLLQEAREQGCRIPVLILTAKSEVEDKVRGLEGGADYYLTKPFDKQELLAVMKAIVRRRGELLPDCLTFCDLSLNQGDYTLSGPERSIQLGRKEYDILRILMQNHNQIISKETLLLNVWGSQSEAVENNVEIYISFLRKKLTFLKAHVAIVTIRNLGYRLCEKEESHERA
ncbi:MAG: response regulator transcription factor [Lachnospiraceae bacterium]|nr:response regulator transcription factor [Lachnospiraceae bacterium]